ncbi:hypothetical protein A9Q99_11145 [Gammaproteobacteria bacterium 45_16_T64]|nr:hypothetical protein A9Q99_11145 [Gammaproteobacteria bacterium 45_16_T64]
MIIRIYQVLVYIVFCTLQRVAPWKYYRLNSPYFNEQRGIFSKLDTDQLIPDQWRLQQFMDIGDTQPSHYPVFVKPEWGQNSFGIQRADNIEQLKTIRANRKSSSDNYLIQHAAPGTREFEIFIIPSARDTDRPAVISVTETVNVSDDSYPINGIYNQDTRYVDLTPHLSREHIAQLWQHIDNIGEFRLSRVGVRASSIDAMINGEFHIIEINLLYPMPLMLLADNQSWREKHRFSIRAMWHLAAITKTIPNSQPRKSIFFKKLKLAHQLKLSNKMRPHNERA